MILWEVVVVLCAQSVFVNAVTTVGDHCVVEGLYVPKGETWQPKGRCVLTICEGRNKTTTQQCGSPTPTAGWVLTPEDPSKTFPDCCPKYVPPGSPLATRPPVATRPPAAIRPPRPPVQDSDSSECDGDCDSGFSESDDDSSESFDCCFECCYHCCMALMNSWRRQNVDSDQESIESYSSEED